MKKSQAEIMGLMIIVIIISFMLLFAIRTMVNPRDKYVAGFVDKSLSASMVGAILYTSSGCTRDSQVKDLLIDCAKSGNLESLQLLCSDGRRSCEFAEQAIAEMLAGTLEGWGKAYEFKVYSPARQVIVSIESSEPGLRGAIDTATQPLPVGSVGADMEIWLCLGGRCRA